MRILHVTPYTSEAWAYGGIPRLAQTLTRTLARRGHAVTVCTTDVCDQKARLDSPTGDRCTPWSVTTSEGVEQRVFPNFSNRLAYHQQLFLPLGLRRYLRHHAGDFDVAHLHAFRNVPGVIAAHYLKRAGVPYVLVPNGTAALIERRVAAKRLVDRVVGRQMLNEAAQVVAVSPAERRQLIGFGVSPEAIALIPNPVDLDEFASPPQAGRFRQRFGLTPSPIVMFLGKHTPRKRLDVLARAFALVGCDSQLVIAGNDMGAGADLRRLIAALGLESRTVFTGLLCGRERLEALADADLVVYPSDHEVFGLVPLEALLAGTPVVVADDSGCGEVIGTTGGGLVTPLGDIAALADAIDAILGSRNRWRHAAAEASLRVRATYGHDQVTAQIEQLYSTIVEDRHHVDRRVARITAPAPVDRQLPIGVSFVVPVHNGAPWIRQTLAQIFAQADGRPFEVIVVDDCSVDGAGEIARALDAEWPVRVIAGSGRGAAAAINDGVRAARFPIICQVDQDVLLQPHWMRTLVAALDDPTVAAAQGYYESDSTASLFARVMGLDLEHRYSAIAGSNTTQVCTGNTAYRASAITGAGLFDEALGYGYDNDMSYRLRAAGHRLVFCRSARSRHHWREGLRGYLSQQYGFGYGRLDLVAKHPVRVTGDSVSPTGMMAHPLLMLLGLLSLAVVPALAVTNRPWTTALLVGLAAVAGLSLERFAAGVQASWRLRDPAALLFPAIHLVRDLAWVAAILVWSSRRLTGQRASPKHSMRGRPRLADPAPAPECEPLVFTPPSATEDRP